uniref:Uncharacterized protein n=1 Tax=Onchocerca volvulus TaxID=6282 RepID=A0A8R1XZ45_ONCVO
MGQVKQTESQQYSVTYAEVPELLFRSSFLQCLSKSFSDPNSRMDFCRDGKLMLNTIYQE